MFTPLISMFLHGGWGHILGNALFFWVFGNNIEDSMGPVRFLAFYLICGLVAAATHVAHVARRRRCRRSARRARSRACSARTSCSIREVRVNMLFFFIIFFRVIPIRRGSC